MNEVESHDMYPDVADTLGDATPASEGLREDEKAAFF
jgi:hypothetical protein